MVKLSLCMIVRNNEADIERCLRSIVPFVDEVSVVDTGSTDGTEAVVREVCEDLGVPLVWGAWEDPERHPEKGWISSFAIPRQHSVDQSSGDVWCWIDSDTRLVNGKAWREAVDAFYAKPRAGMMLVPYHYQRDEAGRVLRYVVTQMVTRRGPYRWEGPVHELPMVTEPGWEIAKALDGSFYLDHFKDLAGHSESNDRNLWIIENHMAHGRPMTHRLWQNHGVTLASAGRHAEAVESFEKCLEVSPLGAESYSALLSLGCSQRELGRMEESLESFLLACRRFPERRVPYVYLAETALGMGEYERALHWLQIADALPENDGATVFNPTWLKWNAMETKGHALRELGFLELALEAYQQLASAFPENEAIRGYVQDMKDKMDSGRLYAAYKAVTEDMDPGMADTIWRKAPESISAFPEPVRACRPRVPSDKTHMAIWCGPSQTPWGPQSLRAGIGGSEEAVILLARQMASRGYHVEVYGHPPREQFGLDEDGVVWMPHYAWEDQPVDVFVAWRQPQVVKLATKAALRALWLHDVVRVESYTPDLLDQIDVIFCLSKFHAKPFESMPGWGEKVVLTKNGIDETFYVPERPRKRHSFAFYSSPDRGLDLVLDRWEEIRKTFSDATLDIFYGFTPVYLAGMTRSPYLRALKAKIEEAVERLPGVTMRGMVGQQELAESMAETEFWLYPTSWPETSCITSMKCQAMGCIPITSRYQDSGVPETTVFDLGPKGRPGMIRDDEQWQEDWLEAVKAAAAKDPAEHETMRQEMMRWARKTYAWSTVADDWALLFLTLLAGREVGVA